MCRLLLLYKTPHVSQKINSFLSQSVSVIPNFPLIKYPDKHIRPHGKTPNDGFGFSYLNTTSGSARASKKWKTYKKTGTYINDPHLSSLLKEMTEQKVILGELRRKVVGGVAIENTPPYTYQNQVFLHNGVVTNYKKHSPKIHAAIDAKYKKHILGETDSESIFYLFLTFMDRLKKEVHVKEEDRMTRCATELFDWMISEHMSFHMNIIYATTTYILVTRYTHSHYRTEPEHKEPIPLYIDNTQGVCISSEPITDNYTLFPENSMFCFSIQ